MNHQEHLTIQKQTALLPPKQKALNLKSNRNTRFKKKKEKNATLNNDEIIID